MKTYLTIISFALLAALASCAEKLELEPANAISTEQIREILASGDEEKIDLVIGGIANSLPLEIHKVLTHGGQADARVNSPLRLQYVNSLLGYDIVCGDASIKGYGVEAYTSHSTRGSASSSTQNEPYWVYGWKCIVAANKLLYYMPEAVDNAKVKDYKARALTLRAYGYSFLMENYRGAYTEGGAGLMIYDKMGEGTYKPYSTAKETYDFIKQDLAEATRLFAEAGIGEAKDGYTADIKDIDLGVANFVLARVSLLTGDYTTAISACSSILTKYPNLIAREYYGGKNISPAADPYADPYFEAESNAFLLFSHNPEVIFGFEGVSDYRNVAFEWLNVFGTGYGGASGNYGRIVSTLYDAIPAADVRKGIFLDGTTTFPAHVYPTSPEVTMAVPTYSNLKFAATHVNGASDRVALSTFDVCYMRASEALLMKAEAEAKSGGEAAAKATLNTLLAARTKAGETSLTCDSYGASGSVLDLVKLQWRIEMWGENGLEYYNNKRWGVSVTRNPATSNHWDNSTISVGNMTLEIPANETLYNPNL
ncbi:MAG: RagB/SusD family nutrient uptake outer membrane protein [Prevotellaceae bacterium]|jgi:hypothetical protein|nr:RagB/SusD family nutrient uptake outer membrane protein [Prevotellaceae bacterium]